MDFNKYQNINNVIKKMGGVKETMLNKKKYEKAKQSWEQFTPKQLEIIDSEIATAPQIYLSLVTSEAICLYNMHTFTAIPVKNIVWIYGSEFIQTMYFIPYNKTYSLIVMDRYGQTYTLGMVSTWGFSKKKPNEERIDIIRNVIGKNRKGIVYGYNKEICDLFTKNFQDAVKMVDDNSNDY